MTKPRYPTAWGMVGRMAVRLYRIGDAEPFVDLIVFSRALKLSAKQIRRVRRAIGDTARCWTTPAWNRRGEVQTVILAPPVLVAALIATARALGRPDVDQIETEIGALIEKARQAATEAA